MRFLAESVSGFNEYGSETLMRTTTMTTMKMISSRRKRSTRTRRTTSRRRSRSQSRNLSGAGAGAKQPCKKLFHFILVGVYVG